MSIIAEKQEKYNLSFCGIDTDFANCYIEGTPVYELLICVKQGSYMGVFTLASFGANTVNDYVKLFYAL